MSEEKHVLDSQRVQRWQAATAQIPAGHYRPDDSYALRYPIGEYEFAGPRLSAPDRAAAIEAMTVLPVQVHLAASGLSRAQLDTRYRPGGWMLRQVVHHLADAHINGYLRTRLLLTEDAPMVRTYEQSLWAELPDVRRVTIDASLSLLEALHERWTALLRELAPDDFARSFRHPHWGPVTLDQQIDLVAWHGRHHTAHVTSLRSRMGW
jgi:hypothetical protein